MTHQKNILRIKGFCSKIFAIIKMMIQNEMIKNEMMILQGSWSKIKYWFGRSVQLF